MPKYTLHNYHTDWVNAKQHAHLSDKLFKKGLGGKLAQLNTLYTQAMAAQTSKAFAPLAKKHAALVKTVKTIVDGYRGLVTKNGNDRGAQSTLNSIYESGHVGMLSNMEDDLRQHGGKLVL